MSCCCDGPGLSMSKPVNPTFAAEPVCIVSFTYGGDRLCVYVAYNPAFCGSYHLMEKASKTWQADPIAR